MIVRPAKNSDVEKMVDLSKHKRLAYETAQPQFWKYAQGAEHAQAAWFNTLLQDDDHILFVAEEERSIAGFVIGKIFMPPEVYDPGGQAVMIDDFCVIEEDRWTQVGTALFAALKQAAADKGAVISVVVCGAHDQKKRDFLKSLGLNVASEWYAGSLL